VGKKWLWAAAIVIVVGGLVAFNVMRFGSSVEVTLSETKEGEVTESVFANGRVQAATESEVFATVGGKVKDVAFEVGDPIKKGDTLLAFDTSDWVRQIELERNKIDIAKLQRQIERKRNFDVAKQGGEEADKVLATESDAQKLYDLQIRTSEETIKMLEEKIADSIVAAESDGTLTQLDVKAGQIVPEGSRVAQIADLSTLKVAAALNELDADKVSAGSKAIVTGDAFEEQWDGTLTYIAPTAVPSGADGQDYQVGIEVTLSANSLRIKPGFAATLEFVLPGEKRVLAPMSAVFYKGQDAFIYKEADGKSVQVAVTTGKDDGANIEILEGLQAGEKIISPVPEGLREGKKVKVAQAE
jgi:RND family efflux transporter MFP subunit